MMTTLHVLINLHYYKLGLKTKIIAENRKYINIGGSL